MSTLIRTTTWLTLIKWAEDTKISEQKEKYNAALNDGVNATPAQCWTVKRREHGQVCVEIIILHSSPRGSSFAIIAIATKSELSRYVIVDVRRKIQPNYSGKSCLTRYTYSISPSCMHTFIPSSRQGGPGERSIDGSMLPRNQADDGVSMSDDNAISITRRGGERTRSPFREA